VRQGPKVSTPSGKNVTPAKAIELVSPSFDFDRSTILGILKKSFFNRVATLVGHGEYRVHGSAIRAKIHPESVLFAAKEKPSQVVFHSLVSTSRLYINNVSHST
jgi:hypothetical protein